MERDETPKTKAIKWLRRLKDAIPKGAETITATTIDIWSDRLATVPPDVLVATALVLIERHTFFPSLAEILTVCRDVMGAERGIPSPGQAYEEVLAAMRGLGSYQPCPEFSHEAIGKAVRSIGGWKYLCQSENTVADRARFFEVYQKHRERAVYEKTMPEPARQIAARYAPPPVMLESEVVDREREYRENLAKAKEEALSREEARRMLKTLLDAAAAKNEENKETLHRALLEFEVGAELADEQWEARKAELQAKADG